MDMDNLRELDKEMNQYGCHIAQAHPFYIATEKTIVDTKGYEIKKYVGNQIEQFRGDDRFGEAFLFNELPKDEIGIGSMLVEILKNEILDLGRTVLWEMMISWTLTMEKCKI